VSYQTSKGFLWGAGGSERVPILFQFLWCHIKLVSFLTCILSELGFLFTEMILVSVNILC
jgi:hypothetical protein